MHNQSPLVSVLMPAYNAERYIAQAVDSILQQSFPDFEFLIVNDGSTDGTLSILQDYADRDRRIRLVSRPNSGRGVASVRNDLVRMARGELLALMDADDIAVSNRLELQVAFLHDHPEVGAVGGSIIDIDDAGRELIKVDYPLIDAEIQDALLSGRCLMANPTIMTRRSLVLGVGGYREEMLELEDMDLWLRIGEHAQLANLPETLLYYRIHERSKSHVYIADQERFTRKAAEDAATRRGVPSRYVALEAHREIPGCRESRFSYALKYGWWGYNRGDRATALHYAAKAIRARPTHIDGWKLMACSLLWPIKQENCRRNQAQPGIL